MNDNKVLVNIVVPQLDKNFDILLPINKKIGNILELIDDALQELNDYYNKDTSVNLYNKYTGQKYMLGSRILDTDIRNGTVLILI